MSSHRLIDLTGQKFGDLLVISRSINNDRGSARWDCSCSCGKSRVVETARLKDGKIWNCGCKNKTPTPLIDLTNQRFGKLLVISRANKGCRRGALFDCICDCGNRTTVLGLGLRRGTTRSCPSCRLSRKLIDITGQVHGKLTVLRRFFPQKFSGPLWECLCECGNKIVVQKGQLNKDSSCGCGRKKSFNTNANFSDLVGRKFGKITVISRVDNGALWNCLCECGRKIEYYYSHLVDNKYTSCGCTFIGPYEDQTLSSQHALYNNYINGSKNRKIVFDLNFDQFIELTKKDCFYCGRPPSQYYKVRCSFKGYIYNGIDRLEGEKGYSTDNVVSCCKICNRAKWIMNKDSFIALVKRIHEHAHAMKKFEYDSKKEYGFNPIYKSYKNYCAKKRGHIFLLSYEEFSSLIQQDCYYCGSPPQNLLKLSYKRVLNYNGLDRVNNHMGYELSNVVPCCKYCNIAKNIRTLEEFLSWVEKCYYNLFYVNNLLI